MDKLEAIFSLITETGLKCVYRAWPEGKAPALPFVCYLERGSDNFAADNSVYLPVSDFDVELYSREKDPTSEALIEGALNSAGIVWEKIEDYIESERCCIVTYSFQF